VVLEQRTDVQLGGFPSGKQKNKNEERKIMVANPLRFAVSVKSRFDPEKPRPFFIFLSSFFISRQV